MVRAAVKAVRFDSASRPHPMTATYFSAAGRNGSGYRLLIDRSRVRVPLGALGAPVAQLAEQFRAVPPRPQQLARRQHRGPEQDPVISTPGAAGRPRSSARRPPGRSSALPVLHHHDRGDPLDSRRDAMSYLRAVRTASRLDRARATPAARVDERTRLNRPGFYGDAFVRVFVEDTTARRRRRNRRRRSCVLQIADCTNDDQPRVLARDGTAARELALQDRHAARRAPPLPRRPRRRGRARTRSACIAAEPVQPTKGGAQCRT